MGLLDLLPTSILGLGGSTPPPSPDWQEVPSTEPGSTLHKLSSITNSPALGGGLSPSGLDLNANIPPSSPDWQIPPSTSPDSKLHYLASINNTPALGGGLSPSNLDVGGGIPPWGEYTDNLPE